MLRFPSRAACAFCLAIPSIAFAEGTPGPPIEAPRVEAREPPILYVPPTRWYGAPIAVADASLLAIGVVTPLFLEGNSLQIGSSPWALLGGLFTGPIAHLIHDNPRAAFASLGIRTVSLGAGFVFGYMAALRLVMGGGQSSIVGGEAWYGVAAAGLVGASVLDATVFSFQRVSFQRVKAPPQSARVLLPFVVPTRDGAIVGVGGAL